MNIDLSILDNDSVAVGLALFVGLYASFLQISGLPDYIRNLFNNNIFRVVFLSLLLTQNLNKSPHVAIIVSLLFVITLHYLGEQEIQENFAYLGAFRNNL